jgi:hypothetical protein
MKMPFIVVALVLAVAFGFLAAVSALIDYCGPGGIKCPLPWRRLAPNDF